MIHSHWTSCHLTYINNVLKVCAPHITFIIILFSPTCRPFIPLLRRTPRHILINLPIGKFVNLVIILVSHSQAIRRIVDF